MSYQFSVCHHDIVVDPEKWNAFIDYIKDKLSLNIELIPYLNFSDFAADFNHFTFAYVHPIHALILLNEYQFIPVGAFVNLPPPL